MSDGWAGAEAVLIQDVDGDGLFQAFSKENSAYLEKSSMDSLESVDSTIPSEETISTTTPGDLPADNIAPEEMELESSIL